MEIIVTVFCNKTEKKKIVRSKYINYNIKFKLSVMNYKVKKKKQNDREYMKNILIMISLGWNIAQTTNMCKSVNDTHAAVVFNYYTSEIFWRVDRLVSRKFLLSFNRDSCANNCE